MGLRSLPFFKAKKGWMFAGGGLSADSGGGGTLPIATTETLGAVRVGSGLSVANDGTLSSLDIYSTTPVTVGTWIDGRPVKRCVFNFGTANTLNVASYNIDRIIKIGGFRYGASEGCYTANYSVGASDNCCVYLRESTQELYLGTQAQSYYTDNVLIVDYIERSE